MTGDIDSPSNSGEFTKRKKIGTGRGEGPVALPCKCLYILGFLKPTRINLGNFR